MDRGSDKGNRYELRDDRNPYFEKAVDTATVVSGAYEMINWIS